MDQYRIKPGATVDLARWDPADRSAFEGDKDAARHELKALNQRLEHLQELLYAEGKHKILNACSAT